MINFNDYKIKIDSAFQISWGKSRAYARPRQYDALSFRVKGNANYYHEKQKYIVKKNDLLFVPAHYDYEIIANKDEDVLVVHFFIENSNFKKMGHFTPINPDVFYRLFLEMSEVWRIKSIGYQAKLTSIFYQIIEQIEIQEHKKLLSHNPKKLQDVLEYIHENFTNIETNVESIAKHAGFSTVYLRKLFKSNLKESPSRYLNRLRMEYAIGLLRTGYYTIEEIAFQSGFSDAAYFSQLYKKKTGKLPSEKLKKARRSISHK